MAGADDFLSKVANFDEHLTTINSKELRKKFIENWLYLRDMPNNFRVPDFKQGLDWLNVSKPLTFTSGTSDNSLQGKLVILDFFTYCCINCIHALPQLHHLEEKYSIKDGLVVIGVHSAKFLNEKVTANILSAILRNDITHPVVNDSETYLWQKLSVSCWPTFVIIGPSGQVLDYIVGEGCSDILFEFIDIALIHYKNQKQISSHNLPIELEKHRQVGKVLYFPSKVHFIPHRDQLVVSDTGNHRLLLLDAATGVVMEVIGGKEKGFCDGSFHEAKFSSPQGVSSVGNYIFVADTENHALRQIDMVTCQVKTLAGTGEQGQDKEGGQKGTYQSLSSPWDLAIGISPEGREPDTLYLAMAGTHQIWAYFLQDVTWWKNKKYAKDTCLRLAGSGKEENRNNSYPEKAGFAQPSGLAVSSPSGLGTVFIADSESSTIREMSTKDGSVKALVGGDIDPYNLFAFGDVDGIGTEARLQHPLAVALLSDDGTLLVADSYNHKIKIVNIPEKYCRTLLGTGAPGDSTGSSPSLIQLNEPGGLCIDNKRQLLYISDTNNHCIKVFDWQSKITTKLSIVLQKENPSSQVEKLNEANFSFYTKLPEVIVCPGGELVFNLELHVAPGLHLNTDAPNSWKLSASDKESKSILSSIPATSIKGPLRLESNGKVQRLTTVHIPKDFSAMSLTLFVDCLMFVCRSDNTCTQHQEKKMQNVFLSPNGPSTITILLVADIL